MLERLADWCYRRRWQTVGLWVLGLVLAIGLSGAFGGDFNADFSAMLAMTDNQAQKFQWILMNASNKRGERWHLELRPVIHDADSTDHVDTFYTVITDGLTAAEKHAFAFAQKLSPSSNGG